MCFLTSVSSKSFSHLIEDYIIDAQVNDVEHITDKFMDQADKKKSAKRAKKLQKKPK